MKCSVGKQKSIGPRATNFPKFGSGDRYLSSCRNFSRTYVRVKKTHTTRSRKMLGTKTPPYLLVFLFSKDGKESKELQNQRIFSLGLEFINCLMELGKRDESRQTSLPIFPIKKIYAFLFWQHMYSVC